MKMEIAVLQRRRGSTTGSVRSGSPGTDPAIIAPAPTMATTTGSGVVSSNVATMGTPTDTKHTVTATTNTTEDKSASPNLDTDG